MSRLLMALVCCSSLFACKAPDGSQACDEWCEARRICGPDETDAECLWMCLRRVELAGEEGDRCSKKMREEIDCLAGQTECEVLLDDRISRGDPCYDEANIRESLCGEI